MVTIYVIDNGGQWTHREWRVLKYLDVETKIVPNTAPFSDISDVDGIVLSGGAPRIGARFFGGDAAPSKVPEFGKIELTRIKDDDLLFQVICYFRKSQKHQLYGNPIMMK